MVRKLINISLVLIVAAILFNPVTCHRKSRVRKYDEFESALAHERSKLLQLLGPQFLDADSAGKEGAESGGGETTAAPTNAPEGQKPDDVTTTSASGDNATAPTGAKDDKSTAAKILDKIKQTLHIGKRNSLPVRDVDDDDDDDDDDDVDDDLGVDLQRVYIYRRAPEKKRRRKRWDYDADFNWDDNDADYEIPGEEKKETKFEKFAKQWQKHAIKFIFTFSVIALILLIILAAFKRLVTKVWDCMCNHLEDWRDLCLNRDPTYRHIKKFTRDYGIQLDYDQYTKIKKSYEESAKKHGYGSNVDLSGR